MELEDLRMETTARRPLPQRLAMAGAVLIVAALIGFFMQTGPGLRDRFVAAPPPPPQAPVMRDAGSAPATVVEASAPAGEAAPEGQPMPRAALAHSDDTPGMPGASPAGAEGDVPLPPVATSADAPGTGPDEGADPALEVTRAAGGPESLPLLLGSTSMNTMPARLEASEPGAPVDEVSAECAPTLDAAPGAAAMVSLRLSAPCHRNERATIHHNGMMFSAVTDVAGRAEIEVPALSERAVFIAAFADETGAAATVDVPSLAFYDRVVLQWRGEPAFHIHALELGADYDTPGHVWAQAPREPAVAARGEGGFLTRLGAGATAEPLMAEIYTFPTGMTQGDGTIALSVEAAVTAATCGRDLEAQSLQVRPGEEMRVLDLVLSLPECEAVGEYIVLRTLFEDVTLAAN